MCEIQCFYQHILNWTFRLKQGGMNKVNREIAEYLFECVKDANQPPSGTKVKRSDNEKCLVQKQKRRSCLLQFGLKHVIQDSKHALCLHLCI